MSDKKFQNKSCVEIIPQVMQDRGQTVMPCPLLGIAKRRSFYSCFRPEPSKVISSSARFELSKCSVCLAGHGLPVNRAGGRTWARCLRRVHGAGSWGAVSSVHSIRTLGTTTGRTWRLRARARAHGSVRRSLARAWGLRSGSRRSLERSRRLSTRTRAHRASRTSHGRSHRGLRTGAVGCHGTTSGRGRATWAKVALGSHGTLSLGMIRSRSSGSTSGLDGRSGARTSLGGTRLHRASRQTGAWDDTLARAVKSDAESLETLLVHDGKNSH